MPPSLWLRRGQHSLIAADVQPEEDSDGRTEKELNRWSRGHDYDALPVEMQDTIR